MKINPNYFPVLFFGTLALGIALGANLNFPQQGNSSASENHRNKLNKLIDFIDNEYIDSLSEDTDDTTMTMVKRYLGKSKKEADKAHHFYIVSLRCLHSIQDMLRAMRGAITGDNQRGARVEVQDLMSKLMSGETLTTDELMQLQRFD